MPFTLYFLVRLQNFDNGGLSVKRSFLPCFFIIISRIYCSSGYSLLINRNLCSFGFRVFVGFGLKVYKSQELKVNKEITPPTEND